MSNNNDAIAVEYAGERLMKCREPRKILIVLSDGAPADAGVNPSVLNRTLVRNIERLEKAGVETFGIGIQSKAVEQFYKNRDTIQNVSELPRLVTTTLRSYLIGK
jgi:cobalamin biosynthesis protein CobT